MWFNQRANTIVDNKEVPWLFVTLAKGVSTFAGIVATFSGIFSIILLNLSCIFGSAVLIIEGLIVTLIEAPWAFLFVKFAYFPSKLLQDQPHWWKAVIYLLFAIIPYLFCDNLTLILGPVVLVIASASYLVLSLGEKASLQEMKAKASLSGDPEAILVNNEIPVDNSNPNSLSNPSLFNNVKSNLPFVKQKENSEKPVY